MREEKAQMGWRMEADGLEQVGGYKTRARRSVGAGRERSERKLTKGGKEKDRTALIAERWG
jgi:hypothetical protein